jgi:glycosyltransferase involved in cell wall biosynthesis
MKVGGLYTFLKNFNSSGVFDEYRDKIQLRFAGNNYIFGNGDTNIIRLDGLYQHNFLFGNNPFFSNFNKILNNNLLNIEVINNIKKSDGIIFQSNYSKSQYFNFANQFVAGKKSFIIYNGADEIIFNPNKRSMNISGGVKIITTSVDYPIKRLNHFAYLAKGLKDAGINFSINLIIANPTNIFNYFSFRTNFDKLFNYLNIDRSLINIYTNQSNNQIAEHLNNSHIYVTFSNKDACPNSVIEARAMGMPVIAPSRGGCKELCLPILQFNDSSSDLDFVNLICQQDCDNYAINEATSRIIYCINNYKELTNDHINKASFWFKSRMLHDYKKYFDLLI